jgi:hypothetical protein
MVVARVMISVTTISLVLDSAGQSVMDAAQDVTVRTVVANTVRVESCLFSKYWSGRLWAEARAARRATDSVAYCIVKCNTGSNECG